MSHPINFDLQIAEHEKKITELKIQRATYYSSPGKTPPPLFYVIGGEYTDTTFSSFVDEEERYGPFDTWPEARAKWNEKSWQNVDSCHTKYEIQEA